MLLCGVAASPYRTRIIFVSSESCKRLLCSFAMSIVSMMSLPSIFVLVFLLFFQLLEEDVFYSLGCVVASSAPWSLSVRL